MSVPGPLILMASALVSKSPEGSGSVPVAVASTSNESVTPQQRVKGRTSGLEPVANVVKVGGNVGDSPPLIVIVSALAVETQVAHRLPAPGPLVGNCSSFLLKVEYQRISHWLVRLGSLRVNSASYIRFIGKTRGWRTEYSDIIVKAGEKDRRKVDQGIEREPVARYSRVGNGSAGTRGRISGECRCPTAEGPIGPGRYGARHPVRIVALIINEFADERGSDTQGSSARAHESCRERIVRRRIAERATKAHFKYRGSRSARDQNCCQE